MTSDWDEYGEESVEATIPRDRYGRPMVAPPEGGKLVAYTRATTFAGSIDEMWGLGMWQQRMVAKGLAARKDLLLAVAAHADDKTMLNSIVDQAREAAAASAAATTGTALHRLCERYDRGQMTMDEMPDSHRADIEAYVEAMRPVKIHGIEQFVVIDEIKVGGTFDRVVEYLGSKYVADIKTGSIEYGVGKMAVQLALYSRGQLYNHPDPQRVPMQVDQNAGIIIHLPAGQGRCDLYWLNIRAGWEAGARLCHDVREWRKRNNLLVSANLVPTEPLALPPASAMTVALDILTETLGAVELSLAEQINLALDTAELEALWSTHRSEWTDEHTRLASARKLAIHQGRLRTAGTPA